MGPDIQSIKDRQKVVCTALQTLENLPVVLKQVASGDRAIGICNTGLYSKVARLLRFLRFHCIHKLSMISKLPHLAFTG